MDSKSLSFKKDDFSHENPLSLHPSYCAVYEKVRKWQNRFPSDIDSTIFNDLHLFYLLSTKNYLEYHTPNHLFRVFMSLYGMQKRLFRQDTYFPNRPRLIEIRWFSTNLVYPFSSKPAVGCLIGFNSLQKYELFDEENILLTLQALYPDLKYIEEGFHYYTTRFKKLKFIYFELEKVDGTPFSLNEKNLLKKHFRERVKSSIQRMIPFPFIDNKEADIHNHAMILSDMLNHELDIPKGCIHFERLTETEIVFRVILVYVSPFPNFSVKDTFFNCNFVSDRIFKIRMVDGLPVEAHVFYVHIPRSTTYMKWDGSFDFYAARQRICSLIKNAVGPFYDYNGNLIAKRQELYRNFKNSFCDVEKNEPGILDAFFYSLAPLEKQSILELESLSTLFSFFQEERWKKQPEKASYYDNTYFNEKNQAFFVLHGEDPTIIHSMRDFVREQTHHIHNTACNIMETPQGVFFNCVFFKSTPAYVESFTEYLKQHLYYWFVSEKNQHILNIALEHDPVSLDPRIGGEGVSEEILRLLFEGLTRFGSQGTIEKAGAESIDISPDGKVYTFYLRNCLWNTGTLVSAYDYEYTWKKMLSPGSKTAFAYMFYFIKNGREAKEGKVPIDKIGIEVLDDMSFRVRLAYPAPYFLQLTTRPLFAPINRLFDQRNPQWPTLCQKAYSSNGAYQLLINEPSLGYHLIKNPLYREATQVALDQISLKRVHSSKVFKAFKNKEFDWIGTPFGTYHPHFIPDEDIFTIAVKDLSVCWIVFNTRIPPFHHSKLRRALGYAVNRDQLVEDCFIPIKASYAPLVYRNNIDPLYPINDDDKARQLFEEALEELGLNRQSLPPLILTYHEKGLREYVALTIQKQLKDCLNIHLELKPLNWNDTYHHMLNGNFQMGLETWTAWIDDPVYTLNIFRFARDELNTSNWEHPDYQKAMALGELEADPFKRYACFHKGELVLREEMPVIPLIYQPSQTMISTDVAVTKNVSTSLPYNFLKINKRIDKDNLYLSP